jgi:hypothetical protein
MNLSRKRSSHSDSARTDRDGGRKLTRNLSLNPGHAGGLAGSVTVRTRPVGPRADGCGPATATGNRDNKEIRSMSGTMSERAPDITVEADGHAESTTVLGSSGRDSGSRAAGPGPNPSWRNWHWPPAGHRPLAAHWPHSPGASESVAVSGLRMEESASESGLRDAASRPPRRRVPAARESSTSD